MKNCINNQQSALFYKQSQNPIFHITIIVYKFYRFYMILIIYFTVAGFYSL